MTTATATVLFVEDDPAIRRVGEVSLRAVGRFRVLLACNGLEALELVALERPDVILLDVMMPELDGPGTLLRLRADEATRDIPVIFLTARVQPEEVTAYLAMGAVAVIRKPFDPVALPNEVRSLMMSAHAQR